MNTKRKLNLVKKNFYFAIVVVALLFVAGFVIAAYDASKASHGTLYTDRIETKSQTDDTIEVAAKLDVLGLLINGTPLGVLGGSGLQDIKLIITSYDKNKNDVIDQFELLNAIDDWTNLKISGRVLGIIHEMWASQFSISGLPSNIGVFDYNLFNAFSTYLYSAYFKGGRGVRIDGNLTVNGNVQASGTICDKNGCIGSGDSGIGGVGAKIYSDINNSYIELTSDVSWADLASVSLPAHFSGGETYIHFTAPIAKDGAFKVRLTLDGNPLTTTPAIDLDAGQNYLKEAIRGAPLSLSYVVSNLRAGEHTIKAQWIGFKSGVLPNAGNKGYALIEEGSARAMTVIIAGDVSQDGGGSGGGASLPTCSNGQVLKYNSAVGKWECADGGGSGGGASLPTCSDGDTLKYNSATGQWECGSSGERATYDSGWFAVVGDTGPYGTPNTILTHNLGTINIITEILFAPDSGGAPDLSRVYRVDHLEQDGWFQGATIKEITTTSLTIDPPRLVFRRWTSGWYKVLAMSID